MELIARCIVVVTTSLLVTAAAGSRSQHAVELPDAWLQDWSHPPATCRPLQIVHGVPAAHPKRANDPFHDNFGSAPSRPSSTTLLSGISSISL